MKPRLTLGVMAAAVGLGASAQADVSGLVPADAPSVVYEGRYVVDADGSVRLGFPGVTAHVRFEGRSLSLTARTVAESLVDVSVDGGAYVQLRLRPGENTYPLVEDAGVVRRHTVDLVRCDESWQGICTLVGFNAGPGGSLIAPVDPPVRKLMFIGDSVTCGAMDAWIPGHVLTERNNSNARLSYGMIVARELNAQCALVSYGGRGVIRDWQGIRDTRNAPQFYELALPDDTTIPWQHARYVPDAIGIQLGTNDFSQGIPDQNEFVNAYVEFVRKIRRDAPSALIFLMDSPILGDDTEKGPRRSALHAYLLEIVARVGSPRVIQAPLSHYPGVPGNGHPTGEEHKAMAAELEPLLRRELGW